jgi:hypothetical protein
MLNFTLRRSKQVQHCDGQFGGPRDIMFKKRMKRRTVENRKRVAHYLLWTLKSTDQRRACFLHQFE